MPASPVLISVEEYLNTTYRPDCDYIDGKVLERNMGETPHARLQGFFYFYFRTHREKWHIEALTEQRVQVGATSFRVPDVMVAALPNPDPLIVRTPPLLCVEILSSKDSMRKLEERVHDYARMGVRSTWAIDPWRGLAYAAGTDGILHRVDDRLVVAGSEITITVAEIFAELENLEKRAESY